MARKNTKIRHKTTNKTSELIYWKVLTAVLSLLLIVVLAINFAHRTGDRYKTKTISPNEAGVIVVNYVNKFMVPPGVKARLVSIKELDSVYAVNISIATHSYITYITKDGELFFPVGRNIKGYETLPQSSTVSNQT